MTLAPYTPTYPAIDRANLQPSTKAQYIKALRNMQSAGVDPRNAAQLQAYAATLKQSSRSFLKSALRLMTADAAHTLKAGATPDNIAQVQAALLRLEAMQQAIKVKKSIGTRLQVWLSEEQVEKMLALPDRTTLKGRRDWIVLAVLLGSGLRRSEFGTEGHKPGLTFEALRQVPNKNGLRDVLEIQHGKGDKPRVVPIHPLLAQRLREWRAEIGGGQIARSLTRGKLGESLSTVGIYAIVHEYGLRIGVDLSPHDLRRTLNRIAYQKNKDLLQLKEIDGHASIQTTEKYVGSVLNYDETPSDFMPFGR